MKRRRRFGFEYHVHRMHLSTYWTYTRKRDAIAFATTMSGDVFVVRENLYTFKRKRVWQSWTSL